MSKLVEVNVERFIGPCTIATTSDEEIYTLFFSPQLRSLLGHIESSIGPTLIESSAPLFPGDEVTNLNNHLLYGGKPGFIRFPYLVTYYKTTYGWIVIKRDFVKFKATAWLGDIFKGKAELIYKVALRDRRNDGILLANDSALMDFTYDHPFHNAKLPGNPKSLEISIYAFLPGSRISQACGDEQLESFVVNPYTFLDKPELFLELFQKAWKSQRSPGQIGASIPDIARYAAPNFDVIAIRKDYDFLEDAPSHYNVLMYAAAVGFRITYEDQAIQVAAIKAGLDRIKKSGLALSRAQESWVCVIQSLRPLELIPKDLYLGGITWPQDNISQQNLWVNKPLNEKAKLLVPGLLKRDIPKS